MTSRVVRAALESNAPDAPDALMGMHEGDELRWLECYLEGWGH